MHSHTVLILSAKLSKQFSCENFHRLLTQNDDEKIVNYGRVDSTFAGNIQLLCMYDIAL